jgi:hypothetical protein
VRSGVARIYLAVLEFSDFISAQGLMDILFVGDSFTWSSNRGTLLSGLELIDSLFLQSRKPSSLICSRSYLDCARIIFLFFSIVEAFLELEDISSSRTRG